MFDKGVNMSVRQDHDYISAIFNKQEQLALKDAGKPYSGAILQAAEAVIRNYKKPVGLTYVDRSQPKDD